MKRTNYNLTFLLASTLFVVLASSFNWVYGQGTKENYANTPMEFSPYSKYQNPYKQFFDDPQPYLGFARNKEVPSDIQSVKIGFIGPLEGAEGYTAEYGRQMLQGAKLALEEANKKEGGYHGIPFELIAHNDVGLWGASGNELVKLDDEKVVAVVGSIDGNNTHVAIRVALKLEIPMVNTGTTDPTLTETRIPWVIRCIADDRQNNYVLANQIFKVQGYKNVAVLRANNRYARVGTKEFIDAARRIGNPVRLHLRFVPGAMTFDDQLEKIRRSEVEAVVIWGSDEEAGRIVKQMRKMNMDQAVYGCDRLVSHKFLQIAGKSAEGVVATYPYNPNSINPELKKFNNKYKTKYGHDPDAFAAHAYDGMNILIASIRKVGLNRAKIRDALTSVKHYNGITGDIIFDATWNDVGQIWLAKVVNREFVFNTPTSNTQ